MQYAKAEAKANTKRNVGVRFPTVAFKNAESLIN